jgi:RNA polymerase sigma-70 factor (ECF subfamily)
MQRKSSSSMEPIFKKGDKSKIAIESVRISMIENRAQLINTAYHIIYDKETAEDIIQDIFLSLYSSGEQFKGLSSPKTYAYRIVINRCIDHLRKVKRSHSLLKNLLITEQMKPAPHDPFETKELAAKIFMKIQDKFRIPLILAEIKEMSYDEIAEVLSLPVNTIKTRIFRCREKLRIAYEKLEIL